MSNNRSDNKKVLLRISDLKQYFPVKKTKLFQKADETALLSSNFINNVITLLINLLLQLIVN